MSIDKAVKVNSETFFTYEIKDQMGDGTGYYKIVEQELQSRTFFPEGTVVFSKKNWKDFAKEIKKAKYSLNGADLDDKIKLKLDEEKIKYNK